MAKEATAKQIAFADKISNKLKIEKPKTEFEAVKEFIDKYKDVYLSGFAKKEESENTIEPIEAEKEAPKEEPPTEPKIEEPKEYEIAVEHTYEQVEKDLYRIRRRIANLEQREKARLERRNKTEQGQVELAYMLFVWWQGCVYEDWQSDMSVEEQCKRFKRFLNDDTKYKDDDNFNKYRALFNGEGMAQRKQMMYELIKQKAVNNDKLN